MDTGLATMTADTSSVCGKYLDEEDSCFTHGEGVADINPTSLFAFHGRERILTTVTTVPV